MTNTVWIVDDDRSIRFILQKALEQAKITVRAFENPELLLDALVDETPDVIVSDIRMPKMDGLAMLKEIRYDHKTLPIIIMTAHSDLENAVASFQQGAFEYLPKPFDLDDAVELVQRALAQNSGSEDNKTEFVGKEKENTIIGHAPAMQEVFRAIGRLAQSSINVLVTGESGTGKELVAYAIHKNSPRTSKPFIALNMAAIPKELIESELFGHEKGAFTGASTQRSGRFEQSNGGTLFLDEIGDMPLDAQTRLLRVLQDSRFFRVGGRESVEVDVRIVAATHQDLEELVAQGKFREDLYHRLNVIRVQLPPLRERKEDVPQLVEHFMHQASEQLNIPAKAIASNLLPLLQKYEWPGNVRQLQNVCQWLMVMAVGDTILPQDLPPEIKSSLPKELFTMDGAITSIEQLNAAMVEIEGGGVKVNGSAGWNAALKYNIEEALKSGENNILSRTMPAFETAHIIAALEYTNGRKREAAELLGWGRNTFTRKLQELNIEYSKK